MLYRDAYDLYRAYTTQSLVYEYQKEASKLLFYEAAAMLRHLTPGP